MYKTQVINYRLIYYLGNEFSTVDSEMAKYALPTGGWNVNSSIPSSPNYHWALGKFTNTKIDSSEFPFLMASGSYSSIYTDGLLRIGFGCDSAASVGSYWLRHTKMGLSITQKSGKYFLLGKGEALPTNNIGVSFVSDGYFETPPTTWNKESNCLRCSYGSQFNVSVNAMAFAKTDDISGLSDYGSTISEILANTTSLFNDTSALEWMVLNCTGDFMISALANSNFVSAMNASSNKTILTANEYWARFIALLSV